MHPPPSPARANFTIMTECTPESSGCYSAYSVVLPVVYSRGLHEATVFFGGKPGDKTFFAYLVA